MRKSFGKLKVISKKFPNSPGVYFFLTSDKKPIYIGRAGSLKKRIASYFRAKDPRIQEMVSAAEDLKFQKTQTLLEAIILEANLIKKYWPKYNVIDKDDRSFVYLVILKGKFPKPIIVRGRELEKYSPSGIKIFGPYQSYRLLKIALELTRKIFPYSTCVSNIGKPCFYYQIGLCPGVCVGAITPQEYKKNIRNLILFFQGAKKNLMKRLKKENPEKIEALEHVNDVVLLQGSENIYPRAKIDEGVYGRIEGYDISHLSGREPVGAMVVFEGGVKDSSQYRLFKIRGGSDRNYNDLEMMEEILERRLRHSEWPRPEIIFIDGGLLQVKTARRVLAKHNIFIPIVGLAKTGGHSAAAYGADKLVIANTKKSSRELLIASKKLFQEVRNEAHRFAINFNRKQRHSWNQKYK